MDQDTRNKLQRATQQVRRILEEEFAEQLEGAFDVLADGTIAAEAGAHLNATQRLIRQKLVQAIEHLESSGKSTRDAIDEYLRQAAFTILNRFVALRMLEARDLLQECVSKGDESSGFKEFCGLAPGLSALPDDGYRLYLECLCDELTVEIKVLFDRRDPTTLLWPRRSALTAMLDVLSQPELASVWAEDETIGWVYQYFNGDEERTQMRKESQAPRNSRELAVRNQFFTPRYVVQFLTDNTLGRTWYEMMQGDTQLAHLDYLVRRPNEVFLAEGESAPESDPKGLRDSEHTLEELLQQTVHVPFRVKKDPRDLRILDPACGSGHFLLYTFDLLITIYEEAWADAGSAAFTETETQLRADYESLEDLRRAIPELILRYNLHGVDIDPRAAQIAALALWMRAQRAYNQFEVDRAQRPPITKTNIVVAEPMPGDAELVDEFAASLKPAVLGDLFKKMVEEMKLAGELGSLLKIEESIAKAVKEAEEAHRKEGLFAERIESQDFWDTADEKIIAALGSFAESAAGAGGVRRQLFAEDAAQGVAFIELMRKRFDAVLMNPPFGDLIPSAASAIGAKHRKGSLDLATLFTTHAQRRLTKLGFVGCISTRTVFFLSSYSKWRFESFLSQNAVSQFADFGMGALDATVETAAFVTSSTSTDARANFFSCKTQQGLVDPESLRALVRATTSAAPHQNFFLVDRQEIQNLPNHVFAYSIPPKVRRLFSTLKSYRETAGIVKQGLGTSDDFRFLRLWWEVPFHEPDWRWYAKGGSSRRYYSEPHLKVNFGRNGAELWSNLSPSGSIRSNIWMLGDTIDRYFFRPALTFTYRSRIFAPQALPAGCAFGVTGMSIFPHLDDHDSLLLHLGIFNSSLLNFMILATCERYEPLFQAGKINETPWLEVPSSTEIEKLTFDSVKRIREAQSCEETSPEFGPNSLQYWATYQSQSRQHGTERDAIRRAHREIDDLVFELYEIDQDAKNKVLTEIDSRSFSEEEGARIDPEAATRLAEVSLSVGICFGRWSRKKLSDGIENKLTSAFQELPITPPASSITLEINVHADGEPLLIDDSGLKNDITGAVESMSVGLLGRQWHDLREYISHQFFTQHLQQYSKSRRKAPIYWQLATPSASYSVWCYYHRLTSDTFFRVANDYVNPKVDHEERKLNTLRQEAGPDPSGKQRKEIDAQETFVAELRAFLTEVKRIAPLWNPNLNDGVIINFAPLWRLVPQHKAWQKECKKVWDKLVKGDYDWAHLAMHLWPERVVPKCLGDCSLAIAHGLEDDFWVEDGDEKWHERKPPEGGWDQYIQQLVDERSSPGVQAALTNLLEAPTLGSRTTGTKRRSKSGAS